MNQADFGSNASPNAPQLPPNESGQQASTSGTSTFAVLVGIGFLFITTFFVLSLVAVWKRSEASATPIALVPTTFVETKTEAPSPLRTDSEVWLDATVNIKRLEMGPGKLRALPGLNGSEVAKFPHDSAVQVARSTMKVGPTWYRVKGEKNGTVYEGWMHSDIVKLAP